MAEGLDVEDAKLVVLARAAMARAEAGSGAAVRGVDGRTYAAAPVDLSTLKPSSWRDPRTIPGSSRFANSRQRPPSSSPTAPATCYDAERALTAKISRENRTVCTLGDG